MGFEHVGEVLQHPLRRFKPEQKQHAVDATLLLLWVHWEQHLEEWIKANDIGSMYVTTLQRDQVTEMLLSTDIKVVNKKKEVETIAGIFGRA